jgi:hypothetical protein
MRCSRCGKKAAEERPPEVGVIDAQKKRKQSMLRRMIEGVPR